MTDTETWLDEADQEATRRLRGQLHTRIAAAPLLAPLGLVLALPIRAWLHDTPALGEAWWLVLTPCVLGVLAGLLAAVDNLWTVLVIDRYDGMLEVRPAERGALTLSAILAVTGCSGVLMAGALLSLTPDGWRWLAATVGL